MNPLDLGTSFTFKLVVNNINFAPMNSYESEDEIILFAIVPEKPASVTEVTSLTTGSQIGVSYGCTVTGGSSIQSYHLQYGNGLSGEFYDLTSPNAISMSTTFTMLGTT